MIPELQPYPEMKDSGVEWLGEVPEHWAILRMKNVALMIMGQSPPSSECNIDQRGIPFLQGCGEFGQNHPSPEQYCQKPSKISPLGSILLSVRAPVGKLNCSDMQYGIGRGLCAIKPNSRECVRSYLMFFLEGSSAQLLICAAGSTYDAVSIGDVGSLSVALPPLSEQTTITRFLDHVTDCIDRYIRAKEKLIKLLKEQKQVIVHDAVTGRFDVRTGKSYPAYKDSGVEWLGAVPEDWEVV